MVLPQAVMPDLVYSIRKAIPTLRSRCGMEYECGRAGEGARRGAGAIGKMKCKFFLTKMRKKSKMQYLYSAKVFTNH